MSLLHPAPWTVEDHKPRGLGNHVAKVVSCEVEDDRLVWSLELLYPDGPACQEKWTLVTGRVWQPWNTNRLCLLLAALGYEDPRGVRGTSPHQLCGKELVLQVDVIQNMETGELQRVVSRMMKFDPEQWPAYLEAKAKGRR